MRAGAPVEDVAVVGVPDDTWGEAVTAVVVRDGDTSPADLRAFAHLPVTRYIVGPANEQMAVHVSGQLIIGRTPLICLAGFQRNMSDFADFAAQFRRSFGEDWPVILIDLKGRGRSSDRSDTSRYVSTIDAMDVIQLMAALGVESGLFVGQGHGGRVVVGLGRVDGQ